MKILKVTLSLYKRLMLRGTKYIEITPESKIQLILGTNGSGKSSLIKELSPMPGVHTQYEKGGFKIFEATHNNNHYILKSLFHEKGNKYHFIKNGIDLMGEGGNASVYKDLVKQEFGITPEIHSLMLGDGKDGKFTAMDISKRRGWLTRFSDVDYTYAMSYYKRLKEQLRECTIGIKLQQARLVQENEKLLKPEEELKHRQDIKALNDLLNSFLEMKVPSRTNVEDRLQAIRVLDSTLEAHTKNLSAHYNTHQRNRVKFKSIEEIDTEIIGAQAAIQSSQYFIDKLCEVIEQQNKSMGVLQHNNIQSVSDIDVIIDNLGQQIRTEAQQIQLNLTFEDYRSASISLNTIRPQLIENLMEMEENKDKRYSRDNYQIQLEKLRSIEVLLKNCNQQLEHANLQKKELEHLKEHGETTCPKCEYKWFRGYDEVTYRKVCMLIETNSTLQLELTRKSMESLEVLEHTKSYLEQYRAYNAIVNSTPALKPFWDYVLETSMIFNNPKNLISAMETLAGDFVQIEKMELTKLKMKENLDLKVLLSRNQQTNLSKLLEESEKSNAELFSTNTQLQELRAHLQQLNGFKKNWQSMDTCRDSIDRLLKSRDEYTEGLKELYAQKALNEYIRLTQMELATKEQIISRANVQHSVIDNLKSQITELSEKAEILKIAVKELSPAEGLIAKGLTGFINHFIAQVNSFIKKVWLYPLELTPIIPDAEEDVELDYKFSVRVNDDMEPIDDIDLCSSGMKEIIDLAFRVVSMQYIGHHESPLFLDEFGAKLDAAHRRSAFHVITNLLATSNFSQIFMISHYEDSYGSLANTDITVLCDQNIEISENSVFNRNTIIR